MEGLVFGLVDNGILILGAYTGLEFDRLFTKGNGALGAVVGAGLGNTISDAVASLLESMTINEFFFGVILGCLLPMLLIPVIEKYIRKSI
tara:strand:- start:552 stop:821 length:270 start_codon:yes stop_codon:yes gene_type:complete